MKRTKFPELCLYVQFEGPSGGSFASRRYVHVSAGIGRVVETNGETFIEGVGNIDESHFVCQALNHLQVWSQGDWKGDDGGDGLSGDLYGWSLRFRDAGTLDLREIEAMHRLIVRVSRGVDRLQEREGTCSTFGLYVLRVARVLGIPGMLVERTPDAQELAGDRWKPLGLLRAQQQIDGRIRDWQQQPAAEESAA